MILTIHTYNLLKPKYYKVENLFMQDKISRKDYFCFVDYYQKKEIRKLYTINLN